MLLLMQFGNLNASEPKQYSFLDKLSEQPLIHDSKVNLTFRNYGKYLNDNELGNKMIHSAWGQSIGVNYESGYLGDTVGFDVSFIGVAKLAASKYFATRSLLWNDGDGFKKSNAKGFEKFSQRYLKFKLGNKNTIEYKAKYGWQILKNYAVLTASDQLTRNSYLGYSGSLYYKNFSIDSLYVTSSINRDSPEKTQFRGANKNKIDYINSIGINYKDKDLVFHYAYGEADDYMQRHLIEMNYKVHPQFSLGSQIYANIPLDGYKTLPEKKKAANGNSWHYAIDGKWQQDSLGIKLGVAYTKADKHDDSLGYFERHITKNARWRFNALTSAAYHYQRNKELAVTLLTDYRYAQDFYTAVQINYGQFKYKNLNFRDGEINFINAWNPSDSRLKNLTVFSKIGKGLTFKNAKDNQPKFHSDGSYKRASSISGEIIIDYKFNLL